MARVFLGLTSWLHPFSGKQLYSAILYVGNNQTMDANLIFVHSPVERHPGWIHNSALVNGAAANTDVPAPLQRGKHRQEV